MSLRVPTPDVSIVDLTAVVEKATTAEEVNRIFAEDERQKRMGAIERRGFTLVGDVEPLLGLHERGGVEHLLDFHR